MIAIIDYDAGNIKSVEKALAYLGEEVRITRDREEILASDGVILPGVGAFGDAMEKLHTYGLVDVIREVVRRQIPFLGICLGLQLMFESSEETPGVEGLHLLDGTIRRIPAAPGLKIPHIGWNSLELINKNHFLFSGLNEEELFFYFVHSFYCKPTNQACILAETRPVEEFSVPAIVQKDNVYGMQFHPERSGRTGLQLLNNFINKVNN